MKNIDNKIEHQKVREIKLSDLTIIKNIEDICFKEPYSTRILEFFIKNNFYPSVLIENRETIVGYAIGLLKFNNYAHVVSIAVHPNYRNLGNGSKLLKSLIEIFKKNNKSRVQLEVRVSNEPAIKLYKKFNFKIIGIKKEYYINKENAYFMELKLDIR
ncbi:MAG: ribosomal protein S18-alanine N-acetyltransferase [Candidatus Helarchaeota archaeon]